MTEKVSALAWTKYEIATDFYEVLAMTEKVSALVMASHFVSARSNSDEAVLRMQHGKIHAVMQP
jgi:hypothetical protein